MPGTVRLLLVLGVLALLSFPGLVAADELDDVAVTAEPTTAVQLGDAVANAPVISSELDGVGEGGPSWEEMTQLRRQLQGEMAPADEDAARLQAALNEDRNIEALFGWMRESASRSCPDAKCDSRWYEFLAAKARASLVSMELEEARYYLYGGPKPAYLPDSFTPTEPGTAARVRAERHELEVRGRHHDALAAARAAEEEFHTCQAAFGSCRMSDVRNASLPVRYPFYAKVYLYEHTSRTILGVYTGTLSDAYDGPEGRGRYGYYTAPHDLLPDCWLLSCGKSDPGRTSGGNSYYRSMADMYFWLVMPEPGRPLPPDVFSHKP